MSRTIRQRATFRASPHEVYELLMDGKKHAGFTGAPASISRKAGGAFTAYDGWIEGQNLELVPDKKIVQRWRGTDWPAGHFSTATFALKAVKGGTELAFTQTGVPEEHAKDISEGWKEHYWEKMKRVLEKNRARPT